MSTIPKRVADRLVAGIKRFQPILASAKARDDGEAGTSTIVKDMLAEIFGYDKYSDISNEYAIRGTYCDLAIKIDGVLQTLVEIKAIGTVLKDNHMKQAIDYAANQGVEWVALTNGNNWRIIKVTFTKPIDYEVVVEIDFSALNPKNPADLEMLYLWCKEGWVKSVVGEYYEQKQSLSRYYVGAIMLSDPVLKAIRQELRRLSPNVKIDLEHITKVLTAEVLKREVLEGDKAQQARTKITKAAKKAQRMRKNATESHEETTVEAGDGSQAA